MRPSFEDCFMEIARTWAKRSTCLRRQVGAVLVRDNRIIASGYNGQPTGATHCTSCLREELGIPSGQRYEISRSIHAEQNAIIQCALHGISTKDSILYVTTSYPCFICSKMIVQAGIIKVVTDPAVKVFPESAEVFQAAGIPVREYCTGGL